jgi:hypothetical protein
MMRCFEPKHSVKHASYMDRATNPCRGRACKLAPGIGPCHDLVAVDKSFVDVIWRGCTAAYSFSSVQLIT